MKPPYKPIGPSFHINYVLLGVLLVFALLGGGLYLIFEGKLTTETIERVPWEDGFTVLVVIAILGRMWWKKYRGSQEKTENDGNEENIMASEKAIGIMTGVSYFFLAVIVIFVIFPVLALIISTLKGGG